MKKKTAGPKKPKTRTYDEQEARIVELDSELLMLEARFKDIESQIDKKRQEWLKQTVMEGGQFFQATLNSMLKDIFEFMKIAPIWELIEIRDTGVFGATSKKMLQPYYDKGWRMLGFCYDEAKGERVGVTLHRPKVPETYEDFRSIYEDFLMGKAAPQNRTVKGDKKRPVKKVAKKRSTKSKSK